MGASLRAAAWDLYANSWRVVPVNLVFGVWLLVVLFAWGTGGSLAAVIVSAGLAWPLAGLFRLGALATRGRDVNLSDAVDVVRATPWRLLGVGLGFGVSILVLVTNVLAGLLIGGFVPWAVAVSALWGLVVLVTFGFAFWPLLVDPAREAMRWRDRAQLAGLLVVAHPLRLVGLAAFLGVLLAVSTALVAVLLSVGMAFVALVACRYVLPASDRLEARLAERRAAAAPQPQNR